MCPQVNSYTSNFQEAMMLSSLQPELDQRQVPLYGILHEELGAEKFKNYLKGEIFFDKEVFTRMCI